MKDNESPTREQTTKHASEPTRQYGREYHLKEHDIDFVGERCKVNTITGSRIDEHVQFVERIERATQDLLGNHPVRIQIQQWCEEYRAAAEDIVNDRGLSLPCIGIIGAKGQGKTWVARQWILDNAIAQLLPSGVLAKEATTKLHWIGPIAPEVIHADREVYVACPTARMLDLKQPYMLLDTPGYTDEDAGAAAIAKEALSLAPIKLLVARRDQLRSAIHVQLAALTEGSVCVPIITAAPVPSTADEHTQQSTRGNSSNTDSLKQDLAWYTAALTVSAPGTRFLEPITVADFEATGDEIGIGMQLQQALQSRLANEDLKVASATKSVRLQAAMDRLRHRVAQAISGQVPQLASAIDRLTATADALPTQAIETVLGSKQTLRNAIRDRIRGEIISGTGLFWFPYRTLLGILGFTHGAWDRLVLSMTGSLPSIFGTFVTLARNLTNAKQAHQELRDGIKDQLTRQVQDQLLPAQQEFYRAIERIRSTERTTERNRNILRDSHQVETGLRIRMGGIDALQTEAREVFESTLEKHRISRWVLQCLGLLASLVFWGLMAGPIIAVYRQYFLASLHAWSDGTKDLGEFPSPSPTMMITAFGISILPVLLIAMLVMGWFQRAKRLDAIADEIYARELQKVDALKQDGTIRLYYEDPLLENAEYLTSL